MAGRTGNPTRQAPRTLAEKLQWLRELKTGRDEQPPSYDMTARRITELTGISISGPYFWELVTGRTTNPKLHHLQALAKYFNVPIAYLVDENGDFERLESELEMLQALKQRDVRGIRLEGGPDSQADLATLQGLLGRLQLLDGFGDEDVRETALRLRSLDPRQREVFDEMAGDFEHLEALCCEAVRQISMRASELSDGSQQAVLRLVEHLWRLENAGDS